MVDIMSATVQRKTARIVYFGQFVVPVLVFILFLLLLKSVFVLVTKMRLKSKTAKLPLFLLRLPTSHC